MIIIDKTLLFKSIYQGFGHREYVNITAVQNAIRTSYEKAAQGELIIVNDNTYFHPKAKQQTPFNSAVFKYINMFMKQRQLDKSIILINHKNNRINDVVKYAPKITRIETTDPLLLALWLKNPLIEFNAKFGRKFKLSGNWYYLALKNDYAVDDRAALKNLIETIVALTPTAKHSGLTGLGQKAFNELVSSPLAREQLLTNDIFKLRLIEAKKLLLSALQKRPNTL